ncbi:unnamed protein product [Mesocestoides corti]|uniref:BZIP domain-containing protein n=1 Tax=Mesocestoides corti TaxID=53468 RepID=A0A158QSC8_MESCO|nr:unnamed protein product [Mesocestoides corti]
MIGGSRTSDYLSSEVVQVPESVSHHMMSHFCMDIQDQAPPRPSSLSLRFDAAADDYADIKSHQVPRNYHSVKRTDNQDRDKVIGQLGNNGSTPITPTSFLNPKEITAEQEQFAEQLTQTIDKIKNEREGPLAEEIRLQHRPSSNTSPGFAPAERTATSPTHTPPSTSSIRIKLCEDDVDSVVASSAVSESSAMLSNVATIHNPFSVAPTSSLCSSAAVAAVLHNLRAHEGVGSPPSTTGDSTSPASPSLDNSVNGNRYTPSRYPSLSLPPLRTDIGDGGGGGGGGGNGYTSVGLTDMLVSSEDAVTPTSVGAMPTLADLSAAVTGQVIVNPTTDGFLQLFHNSTDQNPLVDPNGSRGNGPLSHRHLTNLVSSYESHLLAHPRQPQEYAATNLQNYGGQEQQDALLLSRKRTVSNTSAMTSASSMKRGRRRHEPTIAAAQALINATTNSVGQLSYAPTDVATMVGLKIEDRPAHQPLQSTVSGGGGGGGGDATGRRVSVAPTQVAPTPMAMGYESQSAMDRNDASLTALDEELCSDPSLLKIEKKRARNRLAARRCRERKVTRIATLEGEVELLKSYIERLRSELDSSQKEATQLRVYLEQLADSYPGLGEKLKALPQPPQTSSSSLHPPLPLPE